MKSQFLPACTGKLTAAEMLFCPCPIQKGVDCGGVTRRLYLWVGKDRSSLEGCSSVFKYGPKVEIPAKLVYSATLWLLCVGLKSARDLVRQTCSGHVTTDVTYVMRYVRNN